MGGGLRMLRELGTRTNVRLTENPHKRAQPAQKCATRTKVRKDVNPHEKVR